MCFLSLAGPKQFYLLDTDETQEEPHIPSLQSLSLMSQFFLRVCLLHFLETSSSVLVYMDTTTSSVRTTTRPTTVTATMSTLRTTTSKMSPATSAVAQWPRTTPTAAAPVQTLIEEALDPEDHERAPPSSKLPNVRVEYCNPLVMMDISWPKTNQGMVAKMSCPPGTIGRARFQAVLLTGEVVLTLVLSQVCDVRSGVILTP